ncbi:DUF1559 domain-containing protein [Gemmata sp. JC717]|uniref:DUF1559 domain-containing protein n=1 Tax=Gemmata algarum TaxID=2975278 RepID=UPI0021BA3CFB|nr:DUF1559 domain-containing protein [Gemmata algarum]MDY3552789.1 DUF1559 domain-containing protein [Gemmata algarum]
MPRKSGFTLLELLVAIAIIAVLIALLLPAVQRVRDTAVKMRSTNNLRQMQMALHNFTSTYNDRVPALNGDPSGPNPNQTVHGAILPFLEQGALYNTVYYSKPGQTDLFVRIFLSPADPSFDPTFASRSRRGSGWSRSRVTSAGTVFGPTPVSTYPAYSCPAHDALAVLTLARFHVPGILVSPLARRSTVPVPGARGDGRTAGHTSLKGTRYGFHRGRPERPSAHPVRRLRIEETNHPAR